MLERTSAPFSKLLLLNNLGETGGLHRPACNKTKALIKKTLTTKQTSSISSLLSSDLCSVRVFHRSLKQPPFAIRPVLVSVQRNYHIVEAICQYARHAIKPTG